MVMDMLTLNELLAHIDMLDEVSSAELLEKWAIVKYKIDRSKPKKWQVYVEPLWQTEDDCQPWWDDANDLPTLLWRIWRDLITAGLLDDDDREGEVIELVLDRLEA
jgi:hypothetical protein